jgi:YegS/Rv2252/BmrU family lipid kinase
MTRFSNVHMIINPAAGQEEAVLSPVNRALSPQGIPWKIAITRGKGHGADLAQQAVRDGADLVAVYGGDGTVADVAGGLYEHDVPLAILPGGTGNAIAEKLHIPMQLDDALSLITDQDTQQQRLDLGRVQPGCVQQPYFMLRANIGLYNEMLDSATPDLKRQYGDLAYMIAGVRTLANIEMIPFHLTIDGETIQQTGHTCMIANITTIGGHASFDFAPGVDPSDCQLDVFVFDAESEAILSAMQSHLATDLSEFPHHWTGQHIRVETDTPYPVYMDGEPACQTDITVEVVPQIIDILVPAQQSGANEP